MLHVALLEPEIAPNAGSAARTCVAAGAQLHLIRPLGFRLAAGDLRRVAMDYWEPAAVAVHPSYAAFVASQQGAYRAGRVFALSRGAPRSLYRAAFRDGDVLLFGAESRGLPPAVLRETRPLRIPMAAGRSLNLAVAVGVALFEARRQLSAGGRKAPG